MTLRQIGDLLKKKAIFLSLWAKVYEKWRHIYGTLCEDCVFAPATRPYALSVCVKYVSKLSSANKKLKYTTTVS